MFSFSTFYLITVVGCLWVTYDFFRKSLVQLIKPLSLVILLEIGQFIGYFIYGFSTHSLSFDTDYIFPGLMTAGFASLGTFLLAKAYSISPLTSVVPFLSFLPFFTVIFGSLLLKENLALTQIVGLIIMLIASLIINYKGKKVNSFLELFQVLYLDLVREKGSVLVIFTSLTWAFAIPFDKISMQYVNPIPHALYHSLLCCLMFSIAKFFSKTDPWFGGEKMRIPYRSLILAVINVCFAMVLQFMAYTVCFVGLVETGKRAISLIANLFIGALIFKERLNKFKVAGTLLIFLATLLLLKVV